MGTHCLIGMIRPNRSVTCIYCHYDGYPQYNGKLLLENYQTKDKIKELIELGNISCLDKEVAPSKDMEHTFYKPAKDVTIAYQRDRGEKGQQAKSFHTLKEFYQFYNKSAINHVYLYDESFKSWLYLNGLASEINQPTSLQEKIEKLEALEQQQLAMKFV